RRGPSDDRSRRWCAARAGLVASSTAAGQGVIGSATCGPLPCRRRIKILNPPSVVGYRGGVLAVRGSIPRTFLEDQQVADINPRPVEGQENPPATGAVQSEIVLNDSDAHS